MIERVVLGSRGSKLALRQAELVRLNLLNQQPLLDISIKVIKTTGDKIHDSPLSKIGDKGLFVKELEEALLREEIDVAVHSCKDIPSELPDGLILAACTNREDPRDVIISMNNMSLHDLPRGAIIGTSSLRRTCQVKALRPDLNIKSIRGNLDTRLLKLEQDDYDAIILAAAGVLRLGHESKISEYLPLTSCIPAVGQGVICLEIKKSRTDIWKLLQSINNPKSYTEITVERSFLSVIGGGCQIPVGANANLIDNHITLNGFIGDLHGEQIVKGTKEGKPSEAKEIGIKLAQFLLDNGGKSILKEISSNITPEP